MHVLQKGGGTNMYLTIKQQVKHLSKSDYKTLRELCHIAKNFYNQGLYNVRQYYFENKEYLSYEQNYALLKECDNYKLINSNMAQQILKEVDGVFRSFFGLLKRAGEGNYSFHDISLPHYLKKDGFATLVIGFVRINGNQLTIPYSRSFKKGHKPITITIPPILLARKIKEIRIIPKSDARFFEIQYTYEVKEEQRKSNHDKVLAIDVGMNNLAACVTSTGEAFIIDGRRLKAVNQWFNKRDARLQSIKDKQGIKGTTNQQKALYRRRNNQVNDYVLKTARIIINYCLLHGIGTLVIGYNETLQRGSRLGKRNNQQFVNLPLGKIKEKLEYLCKLYGIRFVKQEESYTSKASFFDRDFLPSYNADNSQAYEFSGARVKRGLYKHSHGFINADVNGALNILRKSNVVSLEGLYARGEVDTPIRIRIA